MRYLSTYRQLKMYRTTSSGFMFDPKDKKKPKVGTELIILKPGLDNLIDILENKTFYLRYFQSYFTEKLTRQKMMTGKIITKRQKLVDVYADIKKRLPFIKFTYLDPKQYQNKNLIYDTSIKLSMIDYVPVDNRMRYIKQVSMIIDSLITDPRFANWSNKYIIMQIDSSARPIESYYMRQNIASLNQVMLHRLFYMPETLTEYIGKKFIFINQTGIFTWFELKAEHLAEKSQERSIMIQSLKRFFKIMYAYNVSDVDEISQSEDAFEVETKEEAEQAESPFELRVNAMANAISKGNKVSANRIKNELIDSEGEPEDVEDEETYDYDEAADDEDSILNTIEKNRKAILKEEEELAKSAEEERVDEDIAELDKNSMEITDALENPDDYIDEEIEKEAEKVVKKAKKTQVPRQHTEKELKRIKELEDNFQSIKVQGDSEHRDFKKMLKDFEAIQFPTKDLPVDDVNASIKQTSAHDFTVQYEKKMLDATIVAIMKQFENNKEIKLICTGMKKEDVSDNLNAMWKYTFEFEDEFGKKHKIAYNVPKLVNGKFFYIAGVKKMLETQIALIPVVKLGPERVNIQTAHNRMELTRFGTTRSFDPKITALKKYIDHMIPGNGKFGITVKIGNSSTMNLNYPTTLEYDNLSKSYYLITVETEDKKSGVTFMFNQHDIRLMMEDAGINYVDKPNSFPVAITHDRKVISINRNTGTDTEGKHCGVTDLIVSAIKKFSKAPDVETYFGQVSVPKSYTYTRLFYISRNIAFGVFLGYLFGLETLMQRMSLKYEFTPTRKHFTNRADKLKQHCIVFKDGFLYYDVNPVRNSLIMNGINAEMNCANYNFADMNEPDPYLDAMQELFRTKQMAKGYIAAREFMMDPISVEVMKYLGLPYEFLDVMLYANSLLADNSSNDPKSMKINRLRKMEVIPLLMYKSMVESFMKYRNRQNRKGSTMSVDENDVLKRIMDSGVCNDYDTLNPVREIDTEGTLTWKGPGGCGIDDAYTLSRRAYDKSMIGTVAASSPDSSSVGITRYMSMNPKIINLLGFVENGEEIGSKGVDYGNLGSASELTAPFAIDHDDPKRLAFVTKETKHLMPSNDTDPQMIGNGVEKVLPYMASNDFSVVAKQDGKVIFLDKENLGIAIVRYKDGTKETIDIKDREHRNGGMSMYIEARRDFKFKKGDSFKKNDMLACNPSYFTTTRDPSHPEYCPGVLANVAIIMSYSTYEDSSMISTRISEKMSTQVILPKKIVIDAKARLISCVRPGDHVECGDPLMVFEDASDEELNSIIAANATDEDFYDGIEDIYKRTPKAKCSGVIHDIKIYYTVPYGEMSDSVAKLVKSYDKKIKDRLKVIEQYGASNPDEIITDHVGVSTPNSQGKLDGEFCPVGKVLIEIFQKYTDYPGAGDKVTFQSSMKTTIHRTLPKELTPYPLNHPERPIDALLSPISVNARMVTSIFFMLYGNKLVAGLKEKIRGIYDKYAKGERNVKMEDHSVLPEIGENEISLEDSVNAFVNEFNRRFDEIHGDDFVDDE